MKKILAVLAFATAAPAFAGSLDLLAFAISAIKPPAVTQPKEIIISGTPPPSPYAAPVNPGPTLYPLENRTFAPNGDYICTYRNGVIITSGFPCNNFITDYVPANSGNSRKKPS